MIIVENLSQIDTADIFLGGFGPQEAVFNGHL